MRTSVCNGTGDDQKSRGTEFQVTKRTIAATKLQDGDSLIAVKVVNDSQHTVLQTRNGYF